MVFSSIARLFLEKIFNDSVHGPIRLHPLCVKIIDTPEFQRLRNIKQLGTTYWVYPAACNNRFEHSLGVCYLAGRMVNALKNNHVNTFIGPSSNDSYIDFEITDVDKLCVEIAGLCHDIGHGPFSHLWEQVLAGVGIKWQHEKGSTDLFDHLIKSNNLEKEFENYDINEGKRELIKELILGEGKSLPPEKRFLYQIVANKDNDIDVDKWDYFLRDGLQLNLKITFDYNRLLEFCAVVKHPDKESHHVIGYRNKEAENLHDMFRVRADLHRKAYQHTVVKNLDLMFIDAFVEADKHYKFRSNKDLVKLSEAHQNMDAFTYLTDHVFYSILNDSNPLLEKAQTLLRRILKRQLYTHIGTYLINVPKRCNEINLRDVKDKLHKYFNPKFSPYELRYCPIKLEYNRHIDSLKKVVVFDKRDRTRISRLDVRKIIGPLPIEESITESTYIQIHVYCQTYNLDEEKRQEMNYEIEAGLENLLVHNNNTLEHLELVAHSADGSGDRG